jgi:hypothetical protein
MIAWRDIGEDEIEISQVGKHCLKIKGEDGPLQVEVKAGCLCYRVRFRIQGIGGSLYRFLSGLNSLNAQQSTETGISNERIIGRPIVDGPSYDEEVLAAMPVRRTEGGARSGSTVHEQRRPAAGTGPLVTAVRLKPTSKLRRSCKTQGNLEDLILLTYSNAAGFANE